MEIKQIPLSLVIPSPMNPRKTFDKDDLQELADNIEKQGLLQPITVRPLRHPSNEYGDRPDKYEIICGERRYRACIRLYDKYVAEHGCEPNERISNIAAIVREMTDDEAFDAMITENLQRKDVDPMEEAFAFAQLQKKGRSVQDIALRFGKSQRFVYDRIKLNSLIPELMKAVKEDKMPISAAMAICKVADEQQRAYHKQYLDSYDGFTTANASGFVKGLFRGLKDAVWKDDEDFTGGCGIPCSKCTNNTSNHGCLFYEMKNADGRCTNDDKYIAKTVAYVEQYLRTRYRYLVNAGKPLEKNKCVVGMNIDNNAPAFAKKLHEAVRDKVKELGYEVVDPYRQFDHKCWYDFNDKRTKELLNSDACYRVINLSRFNNIRIERQAWYVKKDDKTTNVDGNGTPSKVQDLVSKHKREEILLPDALTKAGCRALSEHGKINDLKGLDNSEFILAYSMLLKNNQTACIELGLGPVPKYEEITQYVASHMDKAPYILRAWIKHALQFGTPIITPDEARKMADPLIVPIGDVWCPDELKAALDKEREKFNKSEKKITAQLKALGYDINGNKIESEAPATATETIKKTSSVDKAYKELKQKHPDALLCFRHGDFYELYHEDAEKAAKVLDLTVTRRGKKMLACFPHHALDTYLPKLVYAGLRVAICEQLENPNQQNVAKRNQ